MTTALLARTGAVAQQASPVSGELIVRPNAKSLNPEQRQAYVDAVLALKQKASPWAAGLSVYDTFVLWHRDAFGCAVNAAHMAPGFLPWHRAFLLLFDQELKEVDPDVTLPYWDWTVDNQPDSYLWSDDFLGPNGDPANTQIVTSGPFAQGSWVITVFDYTDTQRNPSIVRDFAAGGLAPTLPTAENVEQALQIATYDSAPWNAAVPWEQSFRNALEGWRDCTDDMCDPTAGLGTTCTGPHDLHNRVHLWVAGEFVFAHELTMTDRAGTPVATPVSGGETFGTMAFNSSPNDPVFFLHHANIDRIYNQWLARHGEIYEPLSGGPYGHNIDDPMWPYAQIDWTFTPRMALSSRALGYIYDTDE